MDARQAVETLAVVGIGLFALIIILSVTYQGYGNTASSQLTASGYTITQTATTQYGNSPAVNMYLANAIYLVALGGSTSWISAGNPLIVTISGCPVTTFATAGAGAACTGQASNSYTITSATTPQLLTASGGNFKNMNLTLTGFLGQAGAYPTVTANVMELYQSDNGATYENSFFANEISNVILGQSFGAYANFTKYGAPLPTTFASNLGLAITALVLFVVIAIIAGLFLNQRGGGVLGGE